MAIILLVCVAQMHQMCVLWDPIRVLSWKCLQAAFCALHFTHLQPVNKMLYP